METARRRSAQRDQVRAIMHGRTDHPDAQKVYEELKALMPRISLGTVYRNLMLLSKQGELRSQLRPPRPLPVHQVPPRPGHAGGLLFASRGPQGRQVLRED